MGDLCSRGCDLVAVNIEGLEEVDGCFVKWRAKRDHSMIAAAVKDGSVPFPRGVRFTIELVKRLTIPEATLIVDDKITQFKIDRHRISRIGLDF